MDSTTGFLIMITMIGGFFILSFTDIEDIIYKRIKSLLGINKEVKTN